MDAYCPRCKEAIPQVDHTILQKGKCPTCGGQISVGGVTSDLPVDGAIAMSFAAGSRVAVPLDASFEQTDLDIDGGRGMFGEGPSEDTQPRAQMPKQSPPPPPDVNGTDQLPAHMQDGDSSPSPALEGEATVVDSGPPPAFNMPTASPSALEDEATVVDSGPPPASNMPTVPGLDTAAQPATMGVPRSFHEQETVVAPAPDDNDADRGNEPEEGLPAPPSTDDLPAHLAAAGDDFSIESPDADMTPDPAAESPEEPPAEEPPAEEPPAEEPSAEEPPAEEPPAEEPSAEEPPAEEPPAEEPAAAAEPEVPGGAHLQLPSIDFSMPDIGTTSSDAPATDPVASAPAGGGDLPAHLQLPNFPDFELPPIPGEEKETGEIEISGVQDAGSFGAMEDASDPTVPDGAPGAENWSVADPTQSSVPPPLPAPPPLPPGRRASGPQPEAAPAPQDPGNLPSLSGLGLPALGSSESNVPREPTLVQSDVAARVAQAERKSRMPIVIAVVLLAVLAGVGGTVWHYGPATVASWFGGDKPPEVVLTKRDKAEEQNFTGEKAYREGVDAEKAGKKKEALAKYKAAMAKFRKALKIDGSFCKAHRNLAIALAKSNRQKDAVEQYRSYLKRCPDAPDKKDVLKIINDWEKSQQKKKR